MTSKLEKKSKTALCERLTRIFGLTMNRTNGPFVISSMPQRGLSAGFAKPGCTQTGAMNTLLPLMPKFPESLTLPFEVQT